MSNFSSDKITIFPTAYRQYTSSGTTTIVNPEARLMTEYNVTNLVKGLLDNSINQSNFVVSYSQNSYIKFCLQGYYVELDLTGTSFTNLYVKINIQKTIESGYKNMYELVPNTYGVNSNTDRDLDTTTLFLGIDYETTPTTGYFPLIVNGSVPDKSWLKFSAKKIGYVDANSNWYPITTKFKTTTLDATNFTSTYINDLTLARDTYGFHISGGSTTINTLNIGSTGNSNNNIYLKQNSSKGFAIVGSSTSSQTVTFGGTSTFSSGDYSSTLDTTNHNNDVVQVAGNSFNIVTRDTTQTISGIKTFTGNNTIGSSAYLYLGSNNYYISGSGSGKFYEGTFTGNVKVGDNITLNYYSGTVNATSFLGLSDIRLKDNIVPFESNKSILDLPIYRFDYINGKKNNIGCIAQDLQKLYPELVQENKDGYLSIEENKLVYLLLDEVKKLRKELDDLK